ncbi:neuronal acetylcholine receptor subunit beta-3-like [Saccostrea echinata]|uniref:neuronal acetylcholine receptor subunit beta-3-like n=1 Tax=Saccostrea echinata TaxID=191078 RepID=UPI002A820D97|nr:neuronal acetylcholine receptor subunit beta-3-like [Saccostrea echinata]
MKEVIRGFLLFCSLVSTVSAYTLSDEQNLRTSLLTGYDKELRPGIDRAFPLQVNTSYFLFSINEFDMDTGKFTLTGFFLQQWFDERLSWDPANHNQTNSTIILQNKIWLPNLINTNPFEDIRGLGSELISVRVSSTGLCEWYALQVLEVICDPDVSKFPFDTQYCTMKFFIGGYLPYEVNVNFVTSEVFLQLYHENGVWEITASTTHTKLNLYGYEEVVVGLHLKRRTAYYTVSLILPVLAISVLLGFVFILPPESGERLGFSTTVLLSIVLYLTLIQDMLPESSEPNVSIIGYILVSYVMTGAITVIFVIFGFRIQSSCKKPVPRFIASTVKCFRRKRKGVNSAESLETKSVAIDEDDNDGVSWIEVGRFFDKMCFIVSLIQIAISNIIFMSIVYS